MTPVRWIAGSSLEFLARRLRFLGFDVAAARGARLEELFEAARREGRRVLTLSARHPRRFEDVGTDVVGRGDPAAELRRLVEGREPGGPPFSRCPECNAPLQRRHPMEATGEVPGRVLRSRPALTFCPVCGRWYWEGSHVARIRAWLEAALGRSLADGRADAGGAQGERGADPPGGGGGSPATGS